MKNFKYLKYILKHKYYFFIEAVKMKLYWSAITHDISKFLPSEFKAYSDFFYGPERDLLGCDLVPEDDFQIAWARHQQRNPHHWQSWVMAGVVYPMPEKYIKEMICDWRAFSHQITIEMDNKQSVVKYYEEYKTNMFFHEKTKELVEKLLYK